MTTAYLTLGSCCCASSYLQKHKRGAAQIVGQGLRYQRRPSGMLLLLVHEDQLLVCIVEVEVGWVWVLQVNAVISTR